MGRRPLQRRRELLCPQLAFQLTRCFWSIGIPPPTRNSLRKRSCSLMRVGWLSQAGTHLIECLKPRKGAVHSAAVCHKSVFFRSEKRLRRLATETLYVQPARLVGRLDELRALIVRKSGQQNSVIFMHPNTSMCASKPVIPASITSKE